MMGIGFILIISYNITNAVVGIGVRFRVHFNNVLRH